MNVFSNRPGRAIMVPDVGFPLTINLGDWPGGNNLKAVITSFSLGSMGNFQFLHTLRNFVYVYVFGERISEINIGGVAFAGDCEHGALSGIENLWDYYQKNKIAAKGTPVAIAVGTQMSFQGFLTGFSVNVANPDLGLTQWGMRFHFHPPEI